MSFFHVFHNKQTAYINFVQLHAGIFCQMLSFSSTCQGFPFVYLIHYAVLLFFIFLFTAACSRKDSCQRNLIAWGVGRRERIFCDWCYATKHSTTCLCAWTSACTIWVVNVESSNSLPQVSAELTLVLSNPHTSTPRSLSAWPAFLCSRLSTGDKGQQVQD